VNIGEAAGASGVSEKMIRYYESIGLVGPVRRSANGYRVYGESEVHTLAFIRRARDLGFGMEAIATLLALWRDRGRSSAEVKAIAEAHVAGLQAKIDELAAMQRTLEHLVACCAGDARPDCPIIEDLSAAERGAVRSSPSPSAGAAARRGRGRAGGPAPRRSGRS
jgi:MerR family transcriptional regulator, copper efflux regulator